MDKADEIAKTIPLQFSGRDFQVMDEERIRELLTEKIASALRTYADKRVKEVIDGYNDTLAIKKACDEALEEAAKEADSHKVCNEGKCWYDIAFSIRALKSGGK